MLTVFYNYDTWTLKEQYRKKLRVFEITVLGKTYGITRKGRRRNLDILKQLPIKRDIVKTMQTCRLTYLGHVRHLANANVRS